MAFFKGHMVARDQRPKLADQGHLSLCCLPIILLHHHSSDFTNQAVARSAGAAPDDDGEPPGRYPFVRINLT